MRVFITDDEPDIVELYLEVLTLSGHEAVGTAYNGAEAAERILAMHPPPDLILMDHRMPVKTGLETAAQILAARPELRIIFISADRSVAQRARALGVLDFHNKPFTVDRLISILDQAAQAMGKS